MASTHRASRAERPRGSKFTFIAVIIALVVGQAIVANAGTTDRSRSDGSTSDTTVVQNAGGGSSTRSGTGSSTTSLGTHAGASSVAPLAGGSKVQVKLFGQDPTTYNHVTGVGGDSSDATETELEAEAFACGDKVVYYVILNADPGLGGSNTIQVNLTFSKDTSSNEPFGFSSGVSFTLESSGTGVASSDNGESLAGSAGFGSTATDITLGFQVSDVEQSEVIPVRIVLVLGNCGPGKFTGNVDGRIISPGGCSPTEITSCGSQTVTMKFKGTLGTIRVIKDLNPSTDPGTFTLCIEGTACKTGGDDTDTGAQGFLPGTYTVDETAAGGTNLGDYTSSVSCQRGTDQPIVTAGTSQDVNLGLDESWVCTITNTRIPPPPGTPALTITKQVSPTSPPGVAKGGTVTYTLTINETNGTATGQDVIVTDDLDNAYTGVTASSAPVNNCGVAAGNLVTCNVGPLAANGSATVTITATAPTGSCPTISNQTSAKIGIEGTPVNSNTVNTTVTGCAGPPPPPPPPPGDIVIVKGGPALAHVGDTITYTFDVTLAVNSPAVHSVTVSDPICNTGTLSGPTGDDGDALLEQSETWHYSCKHLVTASDPDPLPNTATANGIDANGNPVSDDDSHVVDIIHPGIQIVKTADPTHGSPGDTITYTFTVTNTGDVDLTDISVDDDVIGHICDIALLKPQETKVCTKDFTIPTNANISVENVAIADGVDATGKHVTDDDNAIVNVVLGVTLTPTKTPPSGVAFTGNSTVVPLSGLALLLLLVGSGMLWASRRRENHAAGYED